MNAKQNVNQHSRQADIYANYVARFYAERPRLVQPVTNFSREDVDALLALARAPGATLIGHLCRYYTGASRVYRLADGRGLEISEVTGVGVTRFVAAVWPSHLDMVEYEKPQPRVAFFEQW